GQQRVEASLDAIAPGALRDAAAAGEVLRVRTAVVADDERRAAGAVGIRNPDARVLVGMRRGAAGGGGRTGGGRRGGAGAI
ncbi:hypothetical protein ACMWP9_34840, partial [Escherichia coli]